VVLVSGFVVGRGRCQTRFPDPEDFMAKNRAKRLRGRRPDLTWADEEDARTGRWPTQNSAPVVEESGQT
jgi:hypothetical protein